ncbi:hypothetical protein Efla_007475 [Eimeria flavescens]
MHQNLSISLSKEKAVKSAFGGADSHFLQPPRGAGSPGISREAAGGGRVCPPKGSFSAAFESSSDYLFICVETGWLCCIRAAMQALNGHVSLPDSPAPAAAADQGSEAEAFSAFEGGGDTRASPFIFPKRLRSAPAATAHARLRVTLSAVLSAVAASALLLLLCFRAARGRLGQGLSLRVLAYRQRDPIRRVLDEQDYIDLDECLGVHPDLRFPPKPQNPFADAERETFEQLFSAVAEEVRFGHASQAASAAPAFSGPSPGWLAPPRPFSLLSYDWRDNYPPLWPVPSVWVASPQPDAGLSGSAAQWPPRWTAGPPTPAQSSPPLMLPVKESLRLVEGSPRSPSHSGTRGGQRDDLAPPSKKLKIKEESKEPAKPCFQNQPIRMALKLPPRLQKAQQQHERNERQAAVPLPTAANKKDAGLPPRGLSTSGPPLAPSSSSSSNSKKPAEAIPQASTSKEVTLAQLPSPQGGGRCSSGLIETRRFERAIPYPYPSIPPAQHPFYRLPRLQAHYVVLREFSPTLAVGGPCCKSIWELLEFAGTLLGRLELNSVDVSRLVEISEMLMGFLVKRHGSLVADQFPHRAVQRLGVRYLCFDVLVSAIHLLGDVMHAGEWFEALGEAVPSNYFPSRSMNPARANHYLSLSLMLTNALALLKKQERPSAEITVILKANLMPSRVTSRILDSANKVPDPTACSNSPCLPASQQNASRRPGDSAAGGFGDTGGAAAETMFSV